MENTKIKMIAIGAFAVAVFFLVYFFVMYKKEGQNDISHNEINVDGGKRIIEQEMKCDYQDDLVVTNVALERDDIGVCECIKNDIFKKSCITSVKEAILYKKAITENDPNICNQINNEEGVKSCNDAVRGKIEYMENDKK
jgi:predicted membrane protein